MAVTPEGPRRFVPTPVVYVLEIDKRPILAFEAISGREAKELLKETWLLEDLKRHRSSGVPLWNGKAKIRVGVAVGDQVADVKALLAETQSELPIVYLVPIDDR
jgi:hypothetical protein